MINQNVDRIKQKVHLLLLNFLLPFSSKGMCCPALNQEINKQILIWASFIPWQILICVHDLHWLISFPQPHLHPQAFKRKGKGDSDEEGAMRAWGEGGGCRRNEVRKRAAWHDPPPTLSHSSYQLEPSLPVASPVLPAAARHTHIPEETGGDVMADRSSSRMGCSSFSLIFYQTHCLHSLTLLSPCHLLDVGMFPWHGN